MALPLLGLLASQGVRSIATRLISTGLSAQRSSKIARNLQKTATESLSKGKIPTNKTWSKSITTKIICTSISKTKRSYAKNEQTYDTNSRHRFAWKYWSKNG